MEDSLRRAAEVWFEFRRATVTVIGDERGEQVFDWFWTLIAGFFFVFAAASASREFLGICAGLTKTLLCVILGAASLAAVVHLVPR